ncbi:hypothetical protein [Vibrio gazogenes]|uniref:hypothetical protein n=1 Tax=Vibrio gazogenes TaxID=687 RepID=UPI00093296EA|nr:hypothetical protein [Vibrio gazogenes]
MNRIITSALLSLSMMLSIGACQANPQSHSSHEMTRWSVPVGVKSCASCPEPAFTGVLPEKASSFFLE